MGKAVLHKWRKKTTAAIWITREFQRYTGIDRVYAQETISVDLLPDWPDFRIVITRYLPPDMSLPRELLSKYEANGTAARCKTFIEIDNFTEERLADVLADFFTPLSYGQIGRAHV